MKFRIKTEQEFIEEYGINWNYSTVDWICPDMNFLFGVEINLDLTQFKNEIINNPSKDYICHTYMNRVTFMFDYMIDDDIWSISTNMIKIINEKPNYKPKKIVREL